MTYSNEMHTCSKGRAIIARGKMLNPSYRSSSCKGLDAKGRDDHFAGPPMIRIGGHQGLLDPKNYQRLRDLPGLLHLFPAEIEALGRTGPDALLRMIARALRAERKRGERGHWRYSMNRHIGLMQAFRAERNRQIPDDGC